jgi:hypothetical protein
MDTGMPMPVLFFSMPMPINVNADLGIANLEQVNKIYCFFCQKLPENPSCLNAFCNRLGLFVLTTVYSSKFALKLRVLTSILEYLK